MINDLKDHKFKHCLVFLFLCMWGRGDIGGGGVRVVVRQEGYRYHIEGLYTELPFMKNIRLCRIKFDEFMLIIMQLFLQKSNSFVTKTN
jgi:hypothetical protein